GSYYNQRMIYHLCQSTHRKLQKLGLESQYRTDEALIFCGMRGGLAFVPLCDMGNAMAFLRSVTPTNDKDILKYFDKNYINGVKGGHKKQFSIPDTSNWASISSRNLERE
ncbi:unnamed protein product, partial [Gordionus sp. m RMFG-2023]